MVSQEQAADSWGGVVGSGCPQFLSGAPGTEGGGPHGLSLRTATGLRGCWGIRPLPPSLLPSGGHVETYRAMWMPSLYPLPEVPNPGKEAGN